MNSFGLNEELSTEELNDINEEASIIFKRTDITNIDINLDEDPRKVPRQNYTVVSFVGPTLTAKTKNYGIRIMGSFDTIDEAEDHVLLLQENEETKMYDTCICENYKFIPSHPYFEKTTTKEVDEHLNNIVTDYKKKMVINKLKYEVRRNKLGQNTDRYVEEIKKEIPKEILKEIPDVQEIQDISQITDNLEEKAPIHKVHHNLIEKMKKRKAESLMKNVLNTTECSIKVQGQNYVALTVVYDKECLNDDNYNVSKRFPMKIKGSFETEEECSKYVKSLIEFDDDYDIFVAKMYVWLPVTPDIEQIEQEYNDEKLNSLNKGHKQNEDTIKQFMHKQSKNLDFSSKELFDSGSDIIKKLENIDPLAYKNAYKEQIPEQQQQQQQQQEEVEIKVPE